MPIALVDCNSFYCSCEIIFRPDLEGQPVIVLSNNDGCVVARTKEAKDLNINMAAPFFQLKDIFRKNKVTVFSSNYALYADISTRVMKILSQFSPEMEIYSIDEAFLNLEGFEHLNLNHYGHDIKRTIHQHLHIPVSVGIAQTKVLAKIANYLAKKSKIAHGVVDLTQVQYLDRALSLVPIEEVWGIGRKSASKLRVLGIKNALDFRNYSNEKLIEKLLTKTGLQLKLELAGERCLPIELFAAKKKQIISSRTFGQPVYALEDLKESVANYISMAAEKLRKQKSVTSTLMVYIRTNPFKDTPQYYNLGHRHLLTGISDTRKLITLGHEILTEIFRPGFEYKKSGVMLNQINDSSDNQLSLFDQGDGEKDDMLMAMMDRANFRYGPQTIKSAACGTKNSWEMSMRLKSPCYTTRWSEIPKVR